MKLYYDKNYVIVDSGTDFIFYFGEINRAIKLNYVNMYYLKCILEHGSGSDYNKDFVCDNHLCLEKFERFVDYLFINRILFKSFEELEKNNFIYIYKRVIEERQLKKAYIHITQRCNLNCKYCYNKQNLNTNMRELSTQDWRNVIDRLEKEGINKFFVTGGEPLLRADLSEIISYIKGEKTLLTNGTLLVNNKYELLKKFDKIIVSLDSLNIEENELNRENSIYYNVRKNIEDIPLELREKIMIRSVLTKNNYARIDEIAEYCKNNLKVKHLVNECLPNSAEELRDFIPINPDEGTKYYLNDLILCGAGVDTVAIAANGDIYPCQSLMKENFKIGSVLDESWKKEIEESAEKSKFAKGILEVPKCMKCVYKYICGGGCKAITYNIYLETERTNDFMCEHYKIQVKEKIRRLFL